MCSPILSSGNGTQNVGQWVKLKAILGDIITNLSPCLIIFARDVLKPGTRYIPRYIKFATNPRYMPAGTRHIKSTKTRHVSGTCRHVPRYMPGAGN